MAKKFKVHVPFQAAKVLAKRLRLLRDDRDQDIVYRLLAKGVFELVKRKVSDNVEYETDVQFTIPYYCVPVCELACMGDDYLSAIFGDIAITQLIDNMLWSPYISPIPQLVAAKPYSVLPQQSNDEYYYEN